MNAQQLEIYNNKTVVITFRDGEVATARLTCASQNCAEVIVDILGTNCPDRYHEPNACSYTVPMSEIVSVAETSGSPSEPFVASEPPNIDIPAAA